MSNAIRVGTTDDVLSAAHYFSYPSDVINDPYLTFGEKRAILAWWASDACAVESSPAVRRSPSGVVVPWDDIMSALRSLDFSAENAAENCDPAFDVDRRHASNPPNNHRAWMQWARA